jgi:hypothetical protein
VGHAHYPRARPLLGRRGEKEGLASRAGSAAQQGFGPQAIEKGKTFQILQNLLQIQISLIQIRMILHCTLHLAQLDPLISDESLGRL